MVDAPLRPGARAGRAGALAPQSPAAAPPPSAEAGRGGSPFATPLARPAIRCFTAIVCPPRRRSDSQRLRINCITPNPELLSHDPHIQPAQRPGAYVSLRHGTWNRCRTSGAGKTCSRINARARHSRLRISREVYLTGEEKAEAKARARGFRKAAWSRSTRKQGAGENVAADRWRQLARLLAAEFDLVQLGTKARSRWTECAHTAGSSPLRESMAVLSFAKVHVGPDSFLMHAANGLRVPLGHRVWRLRHGGERGVRGQYQPGCADAVRPVLHPCVARGSLRA